MLTDRDLELLKFINIYGRTFLPVLGRTFFNSEQQARNRINKLYNQNIVSYWNTGLLSPRRAIVLSSDARSYFENELDITPKKVQISMTTINHNMVEQMAHYWLSKVGSVERTSVAKHGALMHHVPDMVLTLPNGARIYVEIEMQRKSRPRYDDIFFKANKGNPAQVLYILPKADQVQSFASFLPHWDKVMIIDIDTLIENAQKTGRIGAKLQNDLRIG